jgi:hypothetical protein
MVVQTVLPFELLRKPESQKADGSVDVVGFGEGYAVVEPVQTEEIVENVPRGTLESTKKSPEPFSIYPIEPNWKDEGKSNCKNSPSGKSERATSTPTATPNSN